MLISNWPVQKRTVKQERKLGSSDAKLALLHWRRGPVDFLRETFSRVPDAYPNASGGVEV
jgi:hypothetical protein